MLAVLMLTLCAEKKLNGYLQNAIPIHTHTPGPKYYTAEKWSSYIVTSVMLSQENTSFISFPLKKEFDFKFTHTDAKEKKIFKIHKAVRNCGLCNNAQCLAYIPKVFYSWNTFIILFR